MGAGASSQISSASEADLTAAIAALSAEGKAKLAAALSEQDNPPSRDYFDVDAALDSVESGVIAPPRHLDSIPHDGPYEGFDAILRSVESGAVAPLKGSWLLALYEGGGRLRRRQELPKEAFWTADELRAIFDAAHRHFKEQPEAANAALGLLFAALSYRWLAKGQPDPDGFHLERVANFLRTVASRRTADAEAPQRALVALVAQVTEELGIDARESSVLLAFGRACLEQLAAECATMDPGVPIDPRYISCLLVESPTEGA